MTKLDWALRACHVLVRCLAAYRRPLSRPPRGDPAIRAGTGRRASVRMYQGPMHVPRAI